MATGRTGTWRLPLTEVEAARPIVAEAAYCTPLVRLHTETPHLAETRIWLKLENLQPIGSFKLRGAYHAMRRLPAERVAGGVLTASAGNMAQGLAYAARQLGVPCTVIVPDTAPRTKLAAIERLGGRIIPVDFDRWWQTFEDRTFPGVAGEFVHAFDDDLVMMGNATIALELIEDLPELDTVVIPFGGGGLLGGIAGVLRQVRPEVRIIAAEAAHGAPLSASLRAGAATEVAYQPSIADGIAGKSVFPRMWQIARGLVDAAEAVSEAEIEDAIRLLVERNRVVAEGAGAAAVAVALAGRAGRGNVACIVSGGNIDLHRLAAILGR